MRIRRFALAAAAVAVTLGGFNAATPQAHEGHEGHNHEVAALVPPKPADAQAKVLDRLTRNTKELKNKDSKIPAMPITPVREGQSTPTDASTPGKVTGNDTDYDLISYGKDGVARWNPCQTITYSLNLKNAPSGAATDIAEALKQISAVNGMKFQRVADTDFTPYTTDGQDDVKSWKGANIVYAWTPTSGSTRLTDNISGLGGATQLAWSTDDKLVITKGAVVFNADHNKLWKAGIGADGSRVNLFLHETGHVMGLGHVTAEDEVMGKGKEAGLGAGDIAGLKLLGAQQGCLTVS